MNDSYLNSRVNFKYTLITKCTDVFRAKTNIYSAAFPQAPNSLYFMWIVLPLNDAFS